MLLRQTAQQVLQLGTEEDGIYNHTGWLKREKGAGSAYTVLSPDFIIMIKLWSRKLSSSDSIVVVLNWGDFYVFPQGICYCLETFWLSLLVDRDQGC